MIRAGFFDEFIESFTESDGGIFETLLSWISAFFSLILDLFLGLFSESTSLGRHVVGFFDDIMANGFSENVIYFFFGAVIVVFIFRLLWDLIP